MSSLIFVNRDKEMRAVVVYELITGKRRAAGQGDEYNKVRFAELLAEQKVDTKDRDTTILAIYKIMGGAVLTRAQDVANKEKVKKSRRQAKADKEEEEGKVVDEDPNEDNDDE